MVINWYGEGCFKLQAGNLTLLTDPFESSVGLTPPRFKPDIEILTENAYSGDYEPSEGAIVAGPGEYEIKGAEISGYPVKGTPARHKGDRVIKTVYAVKVEDVRFGFLGHLTEMPDPSIIENLGEVHVLVIPAGGKPFLSQEAAAKLIKQLSPKIIIPSFFKIPGLKAQADDQKEFMKELSSKAQPESRLVIKAKNLPATATVSLLMP